jgi:hypothetical protein
MTIISFLWHKKWWIIIPPLIVLAFIVLLILTGDPAYPCEFGKTYKDTYGKPDSYDLATASDGNAYYFPNGDVLQTSGKGKWQTISEYISFDENGRIEKYTGYTWCCMQNPPPKGKEPYVVYMGHRWYPQYHGIIYVYKDGHEVK